MPQHHSAGVQLPFITSTGFAHRGGVNLVSRHTIRSIAGKYGKLSTIVPQQKATEGTARAEYQVVKKKYTSKIKLNTWKHKSGRKKKAKEHEISENRSLLILELDPANPLPILSFPGTAAILKFWHSEMITNNFALNPDGDWYESIREDSAALHAMISVVGSIQTLHRGNKEGINELRHQAEAVRLINRQLTSKDGYLSDGVIAAAAVLVNQEALGDSFFRARVHMEGLAGMIEIRGGLENMKCRVVLKRIITYADFCFSSAWGQPLQFPTIRSLVSTCDTEGSDRFSDLRLKSAWSRGPRTSDLYGDIFDALELLHSITCRIVEAPTRNYDKTKLSNSIYLVEHQLCRMNSASISAVEPRCLDLAAPLAAAAHLFLHLGVRNIPANARRHRFLFHRLYMSLPQNLTLGSLGEAPRAGVVLLLWVYAIGAVNEADHIAYGIYLIQIKQSCLVLGVRCYAEFKDCIKDVLWMDPFCEEHMMRIWHNAEGGVIIPAEIGGAIRKGSEFACSEVDY
ncbi:hypothetical protein K505DRAFT_313821 [Melanomma pulvis-pyrius CBS 109.77]|uniref:Uncharacterized protein n=1 Tax=Melanomma pulvis-pyrius CBS 109.77 TaxID=1314802 RepID=A0A6A6WYS2_9PLEO|nr:hypothetical protein K505DRAFT_313821 [Melanomma pulvis-pyrius CBS 109.77]